MSAGTGRLTPAHEVVEQVLDASRSEGCIVVVEDVSEAEVRFANNTVTTNGTRRDRRLTVIALRDTDGGSAVGVSSSTHASDAIALLRRAEGIASTAPPADDAAPLVQPSPSDAAPTFVEPPVMTSLAGLGDVLADLGSMFGRFSSAGAKLAGFAEHSVSTVYLGSSTGCASVTSSRRARSRWSPVLTEASGRHGRPPALPTWERSVSRIWSNGS